VKKFSVSVASCEWHEDKGCFGGFFVPFPKRERRTKDSDAAKIHSVPEGPRDRSQARSAWESASPVNRPLGYGLIGRTQSQKYLIDRES
jgi:hypothetical protein